MDETKTVAILSALAQGVNPVTGEILAADSPYLHADVVRALHVAVESLQQSERAKGNVKSRARDEMRANVGKPWSEADDERLLTEFDRGRKLSELARDLGRTFAGVEARLERYGRLSPGERKTTNRYARPGAASDPGAS